MGWLDDLNAERIYNYRKVGDPESTCSATLAAFQEEFGPDIKGEPGEKIYIDGVEYEYAGFEPVKFTIGTQIAFEQNGRKAYRFGKECISASKLQFMKTGQAGSVLSNGYQKHLDRKYNEQIDILSKDQKRHEKEITRGKVSFASSKEFKKNKSN